MVPLLEGLRIVDLTSVILGPYATQILGDLGADVIKVETPGGDSMRAIPPVAEPGISALFANNNRNKRSLELDLKTPAGAAALRKLVVSADALVHNMRQAAMDRLGFGVEAVAALNPRLVYCAAVGFGSGGAYADRPAYDDVIQAMSGYAGLSAMRGGEPALAPSIIADKVVGLHVVYAVIAALLHRERNGGKGLAIEVPMFETMASFTLNEHLDQATFAVDGKFGYGRALTPQRKPYRTLDGWIAALPYNERHWRSTLRALGEAALSQAGWLADAATRNVRAPELYAILERNLCRETTAHWLGVFDEIDVPAGRVNMPADLLDDPHMTHQRFFEPRFDAPSPVIRTLNQPVRFAGVERVADRAPQPLGAANAEILHELGCTPEELAALTAGPRG